MTALLCDATTERIDCGTGSVASGTFTVLSWHYRLGAGGNNLGRLFDRQAAGGGFLAYFNTSTTRFFVEIVRSGVFTVREFVGLPATDTWHFRAFVFDTSAFTISTYGGTETSAATLITPDVVTAGSGTYTTPSGTALNFGNRASGGRHLNGRIGPCGIVGRGLSLDEIVNWQFSPMNVPNMSGLWFPGRAGASSVPDWSGSGNNATATAATLATGPSLARWRRGRVVYVPKQAAGSVFQPAWARSANQFTSSRIVSL